MSNVLMPVDLGFFSSFRITSARRDIDIDLPAQVEFYFSDSNLPRDRFLREKVAENPEVSLEAKLSEACSIVSED